MRLFEPLNPSLPAWQDARVRVIGASYGIGAAVARVLLARGAHVAPPARSGDKRRDVAGDPAAARGAALIEPLDFTDAAAVAAAWHRVHAAFRRIDLVLIVAGTHKEVRAWELTDALAEKELKRSGEFTLPGMVKLVVQRRKARMGRNPATGEAIKIPAKTVVKARIAKQMKNAVPPPK